MTSTDQLLQHLGMQMGNPQFINPYSPGQSPPDVLNAYKLNQDAQNNSYNARVGARNSQMSGFTNLGTAALMSPSGTFSKPYDYMSGLFGSGSGIGGGSYNVMSGIPAMEGTGAMDMGIGMGDMFGGAAAGGMGSAALESGAGEALASTAEEWLPYLALLFA